MIFGLKGAGALGLGQLGLLVNAAPVAVGLAAAVFALNLTARDRAGPSSRASRASSFT